MKKFTSSILLFLFVFANLNINLKAQPADYTDPVYGHFATPDSRVVTTIRELDNGEVHIEAVLIGMFHVGTFKMALEYDDSKVIPIDGEDGPDLSGTTFTEKDFGDYLWLDGRLKNVQSWKDLATGQINKEDSKAWTYILVGGNEALFTNDTLDGGRFRQVFKIFFRKTSGSVALDANTFRYYENPEEFPPTRNSFSRGSFIYMSGWADGINHYLDTKVFTRRSPSNVVTYPTLVKGLNATLKGNAKSEGIKKVDPVIDVNDDLNRGGLDWDNIVCTGFIYSKNDVEITIDEYCDSIRVGSDKYPFPDYTLLTNGEFTIPGYTFPFYMTRTMNTNNDSIIQMSELIPDLERNVTYYAQAYLIFNFQTSDDYPLIGKKIEFEVGCDVQFPPTVATVYNVCSNGTTPTLADIYVGYYGESIQWYEDITLLIPINNPESFPLVSGTTYYVTQTVDGCESSYSYVKVTITDKLDAPVIDFTPQYFCTGGTYTLADIVLPAGMKVKWYDAPVNGTFLEDNTVIADGSYWAALIQNDCESDDRTEVEVIFGTQITNGPNIITPQYFCDEFSLNNINTSPYSPESIIWFEADQSTPITDRNLKLGFGTYYAAFLVGEDCSTNALTEVIIMEYEDEDIFGYDEQEFCFGATIADLVVTGWGIKWFEEIEMLNEYTDLTTPLINNKSYFAVNTIDECLIPNTEVKAIVHTIDPPQFRSGLTAKDFDACSNTKICIEYLLGLLASPPIDVEYRIFNDITCTDEFTGCEIASGTTRIFYARAFMINGVCASSLDDLLTITISIKLFDYPDPVIGVTNNGTVCDDAFVLLYISNIAAFNLQELQIQWYHNGDPIAETGAYFVTNIPGIYTVEVFDTDCNASSLPQTVTLSGSTFGLPRPVILATNDGTICDGANVMLLIEDVEQYEGLAISWFYNGLPLNVHTPYLVVDNPGVYHVEINDGTCSDVSEPYTVTDDGGTFTPDQPFIAATNGGDLCEDANVMIYVENIEEFENIAGVEYKWYYNGALVPDETNSYIVVVDEGDYLFEVIIDDCSAISNVITVVKTGGTFDPEQPIIAATNGGVLCEDRTVTLSIENISVYASLSGVTYQWYYNGSPIPNADGTTHLVQTGEVGIYHVEVKVGACSMVSDEFEVKSRPTCGAMLYGTVFPFVNHYDSDEFNALFPIKVCLKPIPDIESFDVVYELLNATPLYGQTEASYYLGDPFVPNTPEYPGDLGAYNNYGYPIDFTDVMSDPIEPIEYEFLGAGIPAQTTAENMSIGIYWFEDVVPGDYILEIYREGFMIRWAKITVTDEPEQFIEHRELIPGDINDGFNELGENYGDQQIDAQDGNTIKQFFDGFYGEEGVNYVPRYDINATGDINANDFNLMRKFYGFYFFHYEDTREWLKEYPGWEFLDY